MKLARLFTGLTLFACLIATHGASRLPNVVIIFTDDQGYADVGVFGAKGIKTPNLDRMAKDGTKFTNFHVSQPVCSASRASLMTGCYANRIGINGALGPSANHGIASSELTLAQMLKQKGYVTGMAGKWHLGHHPEFLPTHRGFDEYFGIPYSGDMWPFHPTAKKGTYPDLPLLEGDKVSKPIVTADDQRHFTQWFTERAVRFIEKNKERPFFFYLAHPKPHVPLFVGDKFKGKSKRGLYGDVIMEIDWSVGEVLKALKKNGIEKDTLVIFASDNGPWLSYGDHAGSAEPLREGKATCWEGGTRVPCLMQWPGKIPAGKSNDSMFMTIDLLPTIANLIGAELPKQKIDGLNVWPLIAGENGAGNPHDAYFYYYEVGALHAVTSGDGRWKLQFPHKYPTLAGRPGGTGGMPVKYDVGKILQPELYDLRDDVSEQTNVAAKNPDVVHRLSKLAEQAREDLGDSLTGVKGSGVRASGKLE